MTLRHLLAGALAFATFTPVAAAQDRTTAGDLSATEAIVAEVPARFTYSGLLTDAQGTALADGPRTIVFRGYSTPEAALSGAAAAWEEAHEVAVVGGRFLTVLGSRSDVPRDAHYLTVAVDGAPASAPMRLDRETTADGAFAPGNSLQNSYDNGRFITVASGAPLQITGALGSLGFNVRDITPVFISEDLMRFRLRSVSGGRTWEYRVYGNNNPERHPGAYAITDATGGGADGFLMLPGVAEDLLVLEGKSVSVGSAAAPFRGFQVFTTSGPGGESTVPTFVVQDFGGRGGSLLLREKDGGTYAAFSPDLDGDGGFFQVLGAGSTNALTVDGNNSGLGSLVTLGAGASAVQFNDAVSGDEAVVLPADAISPAETLAEAGVGYATRTTSFSLDNDFDDSLKRTIVAPADGFVLAIASLYAETDFRDIGQSQIITLGVSTECGFSDAPPVALRTDFKIDFGILKGVTRLPFSFQGLFEVTGGPVEVCIMGRISNTVANTALRNQVLTLLFIPTAYGTVSTNSLAGTEDRDTSAGDVQDPDAERAASIQDNDVRRARELAEIQSQLTAIQSQLDRVSGNQ